MTDKNEFRGKTLEEAIERAMIELGATREQLQIQVLSEGAHGLLGMGSSDAIVRASVMEPATLAVSESVSIPLTSPVAADQFAKETLETLLRGMGLDSQVVIKQSELGSEGPEFVLDIIGRDLGILIGRRGETLRDLEFVTWLIVATKLGRQVTFNVDVEGYRARRERILRELAKRMAERVKQNRQPITLEAMPPNERRIVHLTLRDSTQVRTESIGEGDHRRVMILPK